ncbi:TIM-barrel domain-containing protein, partial [Mycobacterium kansasii]
QDKLKVLLDMGVDSFKTDFGERIPAEDVKFFDGSNPQQEHNYYTLQYNRAVYEVIQQEKGADEAVLFARSATVGSQSYPVHWG